jgi:hypothetical protein
LHERRKQVVRLHRKGHGVMHIVELTGLSYPAVRSTIDRFEADGLTAIVPAARGRRSGVGRRLSADQEAMIRRTICDMRPEQLKMDFALGIYAAEADQARRRSAARRRWRWRWVAPGSSCR